ncbi:MAG: peptidoglycan DD-metalloendopeptidase family protein [Reichenbachiella sp.]|uniref:peptidoglycan DD-metalloendopeptidase family protein n=1 Tax=Reichenbachiella sp. TaxID=2184521 RepID=UPI00326540FC
MVILLVSCGESENNPVISFLGEPPSSIDHNREYFHQFRAEADEQNSELIIQPIQIPSWLTFDSEKQTLSGTAGWNHVNKSFLIKLQVTQGENMVDLSYNLLVNLGEIVCDQDFGDPGSSAYVLPYKSGKTYKFSQVYCSENPAWGHHNWFAYDIDMDTGEMVVASRAGEVIAIKEDNPDIGGDCSGGKENFVFILHDDGTVMSYVHFTTDGVLVEVGDRVEQGQEIALSGNSGCSAGPHTHVALFKDRTNYDRQSTIPFNYSNAVGVLDDNRGLVLGEEYTAE